MNSDEPERTTKEEWKGLITVTFRNPESKTWRRVSEPTSQNIANVLLLRVQI